MGLVALINIAEKARIKGWVISEKANAADFQDEIPGVLDIVASQGEDVFLVVLRDGNLFLFSEASVEVKMKFV